jgi:hypothetical protein
MAAGSSPAKKVKEMSATWVRIQKPGANPTIFEFTPTTPAL